MERMDSEKYVRDENMTAKNINKSQSQGPVQTAPENYENGVFTVKTHQMFSVNQKRKASGVFKFLRFEKRIQKALLL